MGWLFQDTPLRSETPAQYLARQFTFEDGHRTVETLAASQAGGAVYMAIRSTDKPSAANAGGRSYVFAGVMLVRNNARDGFGYKEMSEAMGPNEANCPDRIMRLLSPVSEIPNPGFAAEWRARVAQRKAGRAAARTRAAELMPGARLRTAYALRFGLVRTDLFEVAPTPSHRHSPVFLAVEHGFLCRLRPEHIAGAARLPSASAPAPAESGHG